jgi:LPS-assembly protein
VARDAGSWGTQIVEPMLQVIAAPNGSRYVNTSIPDEDSLALEFTDANLFSLNRFSGVDRLEGGMRANAALHAAWYLPSGATVDGLVGQAYRLQKDDAFAVGSGLRDTASDIVSRQTFTPNQYLDLTARERFDRKTMNVTFADALASAGPGWLRLSGGYLYSQTNPYTLYDAATPPATVDVPRNEVSLGASTKWGPWKLAVSGRRDIRQDKMVGANADASYEDECFIFDVRINRRYTSIDGDRGDTVILFQVTLKTVGEFGFHAL